MSGGKMIKAVIVGGTALVVLAGFLAFGVSAPTPEDPGEAPTGAALAQVAVPDVLSEDARTGQRVFDAKCAACHGPNAAGRDGAGPPLVHKIYEPSHHGDAAFLLAARNGVRAHHWDFGNMVPVDGITDAEIGYVTRYVRELQEANGIF
jgi:mono/diheme cytochrome c family protein